MTNADAKQIALAKIKNTPEQWALLCGRVVLDSLGWRQGTHCLKAKELSEPISYSEFVQRADQSTTVQCKV